jgi:hypothetical protein
MIPDIEDRVRESLRAQGMAFPAPTFDADSIRGRANRPTARGPRVLAIAAAIAVVVGGLAFARSGRHKPSISTTASSSSTAASTTSAQATTPSTSTKTTSNTKPALTARVNEMPRFVPDLPAGYRLSFGMDTGLGVVEESYSTTYATDTAGRYVIVSAIREPEPAVLKVAGSLTRVRGNLAQFSGAHVGPGSYAPLLAWHEAGLSWSVREFIARDRNGSDDPTASVRALAEKVRPDPTRQGRPFTFDAPSSWRVLFDGVDPAHVDLMRSLAFTGDDLKAASDPQVMLTIEAIGLAATAIEQDRANAATTTTRGHPTVVLDGVVRRWVERAGVVLTLASNQLDVATLATGLREIDASAYETLTKGRIDRVQMPGSTPDPMGGLAPFGPNTATFSGTTAEGEWFVQWKPAGAETCMRHSVPFDQGSASCLAQPPSDVFLFPPNLSHNAASVGVVRGDVAQISIIDPLDGRTLLQADTAAPDLSVNARAYATKVNTTNLRAGTTPLNIVAHDAFGREVARMDLFASENFRPNLQSPTISDYDNRNANDAHQVIAAGEIEGQRWELRQTNDGDRCAWLVFPVAHVDQYDASAQVCFSKYFGPIAPGLPSYIVHDLRRRFVVTTVDSTVATVRATFENGVTTSFEVVRFTPTDGVRRNGSIVWVPRETTLTKLEALDASGAVVGSVTGRVPGIRADTWYLGPIGITPT